MNFMKAFYLALLITVTVGMFIGSGLISSPPLPPRTVTVEARGLRFEPTTIRARAGRPLHLELVNEGYVSHNLEFLSLKVGTEMISPGESAEFTIRIEEPGEYRFICDIASHLEAGMEGRLVVR